jgi:glyoxylase-like metal-dependent hydrolase (beta-lactamase superfamily II)
VSEHAVTLIDAGLPGSNWMLRRAVARLGRDPSEIARVILTHEHPDHAGGARAIARTSGAAVLSWPVLDDGAVLDVLGGLEVIHVPGHTARSIALYSAAHRLAFVGDALWSDGARLFPPNRFFTSDMRAARRSVEKLASRDIAAIAFGHLPPFVGDVPSALEDLFRRWIRPTR